MVTDPLHIIAEASRRYGADPQYVFGGGGNTSYKTDDFLYVKASGVELATIQPEGFVKMDRQAIRQVYEHETPDDASEREALIKHVMAAAVCPDSSGRPSVEAPLHELIPHTYVIHTHSVIVNGLTCALKGPEKAAELFPKAMWVPYIDPGYTLAVDIRKRYAEFVEKEGYNPQVILLQSHGIFVSGDSIDEIDAIYEDIIDTLEAVYKKADVSMKLPGIANDSDMMREQLPPLRSDLRTEQGRAVIHAADHSFDVVNGPLTPDHIVYSKSYPYIGEPDSKALAAFEQKHGYRPYIIHNPGKYLVSVEKNLKSARLALESAANAKQVEQLTHAFGGPRFMDDRERGFIENWEVESYRKKMMEGQNQKALQGKIILVTGGAQGFGLGISRELAQNGATLYIADINLKGAEKAAEGLNEAYGKATAVPLEVNIADEASLEAMFDQVIAETGGLDVFLANAGVLKAGSVKEMDRKDLDFVTDVNYTGYFLCVKHASRLMARQNTAGNEDWMDIVQINSKSGLTGSNKNAAYAASKFGTLGMTQSFALELVSDKVKVNSICPGNFLDGPLWTDPETGLFVQYLKTGKVPGAKTVEDVKRFYEAKVPMNRGCLPSDVAKAIVYVITQSYETGQALPVTGGQVMLN